jgi:hypothetical protein
VISDLSTKLKNPTPVTVGSEEFADKVMTSEGLVANAPGTSTYGTFVASRVQTLINTVTPVFKSSANFDSSVKPAALFDNSFLDPKIGVK